MRGPSAACSAAERRARVLDEQGAAAGELRGSAARTAGRRGEVSNSFQLHRVEVRAARSVRLVSHLDRASPRWRLAAARRRPGRRARRRGRARRGEQQQAVAHLAVGGGERARSVPFGRPGAPRRRASRLTCCPPGSSARTRRRARPAAPRAASPRPRAASPGRVGGPGSSGTRRRPARPGPSSSSPGSAADSAVLAVEVGEEGSRAAPRQAAAGGRERRPAQSEGARAAYSRR